jgi:hypothetical protein
LGGEYGSTRVKADPPPTGDLQDAAGELEATLRVAPDTSRRDTALITFAAWFEEALIRLFEDDPEIEWHQDLLPSQTGIACRRLVAAAIRAWVGGMGSWNDVSFTDEDFTEEYASVTQRLYAAVTQALMAGVNAASGSHGGLGERQYSHRGCARSRLCS